MLDLESFQPGTEHDHRDVDDQFSTCFKNTLAYASHSGRRLFKISRGVNFPRRSIMIRDGSASGVGFSSQGDVSSPTMNLNNLNDTSVTVTRSSTTEKCARMGWKKTKCCVKKCKRCRSVFFKLFLIIVNFLFMLCGWALVTLGIWIHFNHSIYPLSQIFSSNPTNPMVIIDRIPFALVGAGMVVTITSFLGCCGACTESVCFLSFYTILLTLMVTGEVIFGITIGSLKDQTLTSMKYQVQNQYNRTATAPNSTALDIYRLTMAWDSLQSEMNCCGVMGPPDYLHTSWYNHSRDTDGIFVPASCCKSTKSRILKEHYCQVEAILYPWNETLGVLYTNGCQPVIMAMFDGYLNQTTFVLVSLICVQFIDLVLACVLMSWVKKKQSEYWWCDDDECG